MWITPDLWVKDSIVTMVKYDREKQTMHLEYFNEKGEVREHLWTGVEADANWAFFRAMNGYNYNGQAITK